MKYKYQVRGLMPDDVQAALDARYGPNGWTQEWNGQNFLLDKDNPEWMATPSLGIGFLVEDRMGVGVMNRLVFR